MVKTTDRQRPKEPEVTIESQRRRQLMRAVLECVAEEGIERTTVRRIAERAGVSTGLVSYYYSSKTELIREAYGFHAASVTGSLDEATGSSYGLQRLLSQFEINLSADDDAVQTGKFVLQYMAAAAIDPELGDRWRRSFDGARRRIRRSLRSGVDSGQFRSDLDIEAAVDLTLAVVTGVRVQRTLAPQQVSYKDALELGRLFLGLLSPRPEAAPASLEGTPDDPQALIAGIISADSRLSPDAARWLSDAFAGLYKVALNRPAAD